MDNTKMDRTSGSFKALKSVNPGTWYIYMCDKDGVVIKDLGRFVGTEADGEDVQAMLDGLSARAQKKEDQVKGVHHS